MARFIQNDAVSYIKRKKKEEDRNGVVLNDTVPLPSSPRACNRKKKMVFFFRPASLLTARQPTNTTPHTLRPPKPELLADRPLALPKARERRVAVVGGGRPATRKTRSPGALMKGPAPFRPFKYRAKRKETGEKEEKEKPGPKERERPKRKREKTN